MSPIPQDMETILHIGAGQGHELEAYLNSNAKRIVLVEPNLALAERLRQRTSADPRVQVEEVAVNNPPEPNQLTEYNLPDATSLYEATGLRSLYPGLQRRTSQIVTVLSPTMLVSDLKIGPGPNLLVIQAPGAEQGIIEGLNESGQLKQFEHLWVTVPEEAYYASDSRAETVLRTLEVAGYTYQAAESENPEWPNWILYRHPLAENAEALTARIAALDANEKKLTNELELSRSEASTALSERKALQAVFESTSKDLAETKEQLAELLEAKQHLEKELDQRTEWHRNSKKENEDLQQKLKETNGWLISRKKQLSEAEEKLQQLEARSATERTNAEQRIQQLQQQLEAQIAQNNRFDELAEKLSGFTHQISNHFDKKLDRASLSIERTLGLNNYLQTGSLPINQPALPALSSELGLYLANRVETQQYDLIIEFGSGASTLFLARTVLKRLEKTRRDNTDRLTHDSDNGFDNDLAFISPDDNDLPKHLVSFEHRKDICERLERSLQSSGLQPLVSVSHAPLVDYQTQTQSYLHYDCDVMLERIARLHEGRTARFLVLVNGPPLKAGINARFPTLPRLLNRLGTHELDIVLQGARVDQAQTIATEWTKLLDQRGMACRQEPIDLETGTTLFAINQS